MVIESASLLFKEVTLPNFLPIVLTIEFIVVNLDLSKYGQKTYSTSIMYLRVFLA